MYAGTYRYSVSDSSVEADGELIVAPLKARVTMVSSRATVPRGQPVTLSGTVDAEPFAGCCNPVRHWIFLLRRLEGESRFTLIRSIRPTWETSPCYCEGYKWRTTIYPRKTATYVARTNESEPDKRIWEVAKSERVVLRVRG